MSILDNADQRIVNVIRDLRAIRKNKIKYPVFRKQLEDRRVRAVRMLRLLRDNNLRISTANRKEEVAK